jgi:hypothetical protein
MANIFRKILCSALVIAIISVLWAYANEMSRPTAPLVMRPDKPMLIDSGGQSFAVVAPWSQGDMFDSAQL